MSCSWISPKAPRVCLFDRMSCSDKTLPDSFSILACALSMVSSRCCNSPKTAGGAGGGAVQRLGHLALHLGQACSISAAWRSARGLRLGDMVQPAGQPFLPVAQRCTAGPARPPPQHRCRRAGRGAGAGAQDQARKPDDQQPAPAGNQDLGRVPGIALAEQRDHRRPNNRSMSWSFNSTRWAGRGCTGRAGSPPSRAEGRSFPRGASGGPSGPSRGRPCATGPRRCGRGSGGCCPDRPVRPGCRAEGRRR
jgi:hypothetical protein